MAAVNEVALSDKMIKTLKTCALGRVVYCRGRVKETAKFDDKNLAAIARKTWSRELAEAEEAYEMLEQLEMAR